jgi:hypothetical protein
MNNPCSTSSASPVEMDSILPNTIPDIRGRGILSPPWPPQKRYICNLWIQKGPTGTLFFYLLDCGFDGFMLHNYSRWCMRRGLEMKKGICLVLVVIVLLITNVLPGYAKGHGRGHEDGHGHGHASGHSSFRKGVWIGPG